MMKVSKCVAVVQLVIVVLALVASPGAASTRTKNCAYRLDPTSRRGPVIRARLVLIGCYDTFAESVSAGTNGAMRLDASTTPDALRSADLSRSETRGAVMIGTEWGQSGFNGSSNSYFAALTCSALNTWEVNYVGDTWNDRFSSGKGFGGCDHNKKFQDANFGGSVLTCTPNCNDYGSLSDKVSSLRWKP